MELNDPKYLFIDCKEFFPFYSSISILLRERIFQLVVLCACSPITSLSLPPSRGKIYGREGAVLTHGKYTTEVEKENTP